MVNPEMGSREPEEEIPQQENINNKEDTSGEPEEIEEFPEMPPEDFQEMLAQLPIMEEDLKAKKEELEVVRDSEDKDLERIAELLEVIELLESEIVARQEVLGELEE
ncbi:MAG: hypothetical protein Q8O66_01765 [bacterium]|nr:hypothetical protein [bacterium]